MKRLEWEFFADSKGSQTEDESEFDFDDDYEDGDGNIGLKSFILTPNGPMSFNPSSKPKSALDLWVAHTNFKVTVDMIKKIDDLDGVEALEPITPYRFLVGFARMIPSANTKLRIQDIVGIVRKNTIEYEIETLKEKLSAHKYWAVYRLPNNKIVSLYTDEPNEEFLEQYEVVRTAAQEVGGQLFSHETI